MKDETKDEITLKVIARIRTDFPSKFGIPRQSGLASALRARIVFEPEFRIDEALRGLESFSHLWLIWGFSANAGEGWSPTVRPPRLGGNVKKGVFATRSPFRPNPLGLSAVKIEGIEHDAKDGTVIIVSGADMMDDTPIYDVKPYLPLSDVRADATDGFAAEVKDDALKVIFPPELRNIFDDAHAHALEEALSEDPRPHYQHDATRIYGFGFAGYEIKFRVDGDTLTVTAVERATKFN